MRSAYYVGLLTWCWKTNARQYGCCSSLASFSPGMINLNFSIYLLPNVGVCSYSALAFYKSFEINGLYESVYCNMITCNQVRVQVFPPNEIEIGYQCDKTDTIWKCLPPVKVGRVNRGAFHGQVHMLPINGKTAILNSVMWTHGLVTDFDDSWSRVWGWQGFCSTNMCTKLCKSVLLIWWTRLHLT